MTFEMRPYQRAAIDHCFAEWERGRRRIAIQLPTGAGKTVVFCRLVREARARRGSGTALVLAHREELVEQAAAKFRADDPELRVGIVKAERNEIEDVDVIVASVQTVSRVKRLRQLPEIDLVIIDEAHHAAAATYRKVIEHVGCYRPDGAWLLGVSATLERNDDKLLRDVFEAIAYQIDILDLVPEYLVEPRALSVEVKEFDLTGVAVRHGDLVERDLAEALEKSGAFGVVAAAYREHAADRSGIVFTPNIATAVTMASVLCDWGFKAEALSSLTPGDERKEILGRYHRGDTQIVTNCGVLTEGFDEPHTGAVVIARPTRSRVLFSQMVGRGLRLHPGKEDCLVIDLVGMAGTHQLCTIADLTVYDVAAPRDGETLTEAKDRTAKEAKTRKMAGSLRAREIDMLRRATGSSIRDGFWLTSAGGVPFIKLTDEDGAEHYIWIEQIEGYDHVVMWAAAGQTPECIGSGMSYPDAEFLGRTEATGLSKYSLNPRAPWRRTPFEDCSQGQINFAHRLGIDVEDRPTKGDLGDRITVCTTGQRIDAWIDTNR